MENNNLQGQEGCQDDLMIKYQSFLDIESKLEESNEKYLYLLAEFDNFKKRTAKQNEEFKKTANEKIILDLIQVMDDFERAVNAFQTKSDDEIVEDAFEYVEKYNSSKGNNNFQNALEIACLKAFQAGAKSMNENSVIDGVKFIQTKFKTMLKSYGVEEINCEIGDEFNSNIHEAISMINLGISMKNKIGDIIQKGYKLNDKIVRYPKVCVGA